MPTRTACLALVAMIAVACGSKTPSAAGPNGLPELPFDQLDRDQRAELMKQRVVPTMRPLFQAHDPKRFAEFDCRTCHGSGAEHDDFTMPNPALPKLNFSDMSKFKPADVAWMKKDILPAMANLLRLPPHSAQNPNGFGCLSCHTEAR